MRAILACPCLFWLAQRAKTCNTIWYLGPLPSHFGLVRLLRGWHFSTWDQARDKWLGQFMIRQLKRTTESFAKNTFAIKTWRSVAILALRRHGCDTCSYLLPNLRKRIKFCRKACERCERNVCKYSRTLQWCWMRQMSRTGAVHCEQRVFRKLEKQKSFFCKLLGIWPFWI